MTKLGRYAMYKKIELALKNAGIFPLEGKILGISGIEGFKPFIGKSAEIIKTSWPETSMLNLPYEDNSFDVVISDQILEHIEGDPQKAINESFRVLKPGGIAIHTTVFMYRIHHKKPGDFWRFSTDGLKHLCRNAKEIINCDGAGHRITQILFTIFPKSINWKVPERKWSLLNWAARKNAPNFYKTVWIISKK